MSGTQKSLLGPTGRTPYLSEVAMSVQCMEAERISDLGRLAGVRVVLQPTEGCQGVGRVLETVKVIFFFFFGFLRQSFSV